MSSLALSAVSSSGASSSGTLARADSTTSPVFASKVGMELSRYGPNLPTRSVMPSAMGTELISRASISPRLFTMLSRPGVCVFTVVEVLEPGSTHGLAVGDLVQVAFHVCRELVVHVISEVLFQQADHGECDPAGNQAEPCLRT